MTFHHSQTSPGRRQGAAAMTLIELMVGIGVGSIVLAIVSILTVFGARSFASMGNYTILAQKSSIGVDEITRELRHACGVISWQTNGMPKWLVVTNPAGYTVKYSLNTDRQITMKKSNQPEEEILLDGCDNWSFNLYQRTPQLNGVFYPATAPVLDCRMISMNWRCSRFLGGTNAVNTEAVQTAQIVMRNK